MIYNFIVKAFTKNLSLILQSRKILLLITILFFIPIFYFYYNNAVSFHFIDEYNNFLAGYFLLKGHTLYSQIFFQHQPLMAYISYVLQKILHPGTLYKLVLYHRMTIVAAAFVFDLLLVYRFRLIGLGFAFIFELTKYYLFGSTFLAESIVIYPIVYVFGLTWEVLQKKKIADSDIWLGTFFTWFVIFMREPYIPTILILYAILLLPKRSAKTKISSVIVLLILSAIVVVGLPLRDYLFEITTVNAVGVVAGEVQRAHLAGIGIISIFLYPIIILFQGMLNYFRGVLVLLDLTFLLALFTFIAKTKQWKNGLILLVILGIANIRLTPPGTIFFGAYHMLVWYGLFVFITMLLVSKLSTLKLHTAIRLPIMLLTILLGIFILLPANSLLWTKLDKQAVFTTNYGPYYTNGAVVQALADPQTTVFVDGWDSLIYWQADQKVAYPYLFYYLPMNNFTIYTNARTKMFKENPPEFVYTLCKREKNTLIVEETYGQNVKGNYDAFYFGKIPTCLFIQKSKINTIPTTQWEKIKPFGYYLKT